MLKKGLCLLIGIMMLFCQINVVHATNLASGAESAILIDANSQQVLYQKNATKKLYPASTTKIMTMILLFEAIQEKRLKWDDILTCSAYASSMGGSQIFLKVGEKMTVEDLLKGVAIASGNDAVVALAERVSGSEEQFVKRMNIRAKDLGLKNTNFINATGLTADNHYSSAYDMSLIAKELVKHEKILEFTSTYEDYLRKDTKSPFWLVNTNRLVRFKEGVDGLKTGTTDLAGASFVAHSNESGMSIITVILNADNTDTDDYARFTATNDLLNYVVYHWESKTIAKKGQAIGKSQAPVLDGKSKQVTAVAKSDFNIIQKIDANNSKHIKVTTNQVQAPVNSSDKVGTATFEDKSLVGEGYLPNQGMPSMELVAGKEVKKSFFLKVWWNHFVTFVNEKL